MLPTHTQMPGSNAYTKLRQHPASQPIRYAGDIAQCSNDQSFITKSSTHTKLFMHSSQDIKDVRLR